MIIKKRTVPLELLLLRSIRTRMQVFEKTKNQIITLEKGYIGEKMFDQRLEKLSLDCLIINDLLLETANTHYQIDSFLISQPTIHIFEVKNFEGDYLIEGNRMRLLSGKEIKNPLIQLSRSESLFRQLLQQHGFNLKVEAHLVFINPQFYLYGASPDLPIIFPSQLGRFLNQLNSQPSKLTGQHNTLAKKLIDLHVKDSPFSLLPAYSFDGLAKGILCVGCGELEMFDSGLTTTLTCKKCGFVEDKEVAILRSIQEFSMLFPEMKITSGIIFEWCKIIRSKAVIQRALARFYQSCSSKKGTYYIKKEE
ncbi:nuclease-related domain-containing protein [Fredinandcohnia onubensis]|uniref:nuclease-related domain-containing protein n=1 Tax=Fredinandcohnia onubensis TaxID=1571209 RepID=UPI000C0BBB5B|nr:nuclease-related domain-containing protein [Fredinandcohnia onubensis]